MRTALSMVTLAVAATGLSGCFQPDTRLPESSYQWQRRQDEIERREAERQRLCQMMDKERDAKRYARDCTRPGDPD